MSLAGAYCYAMQPQRADPLQLKDVADLPKLAMTDEQDTNLGLVIGHSQSCFTRINASVRYDCKSQPFDQCCSFITTIATGEMQSQDSGAHTQLRHLVKLECLFCAIQGSCSTTRWTILPHQANWMLKAWCLVQPIS